MPLIQALAGRGKRVATLGGQPGLQPVKNNKYISMKGDRPSSSESLLRPGLSDGICLSFRLDLSVPILQQQFTDSAMRTDPFHGVV